MTADAAPLLVADAARVAVDGVIALEELTFSAVGPRVVLAGDSDALVAVLTGVPLTARSRDEAGEPEGEASVVAGRLLLAGCDVATGKHHPIVGAAPLDPPMPAAWAARDYVAWSGRLAGLSKRQANELAAASLSRVGLGRAERRIPFLTPVERRLLSLAAAAVASPAVVVAEHPLAGLDPEGAGVVGTALAKICEGRASVVSVGRLDAATFEGALAASANHLVVLAGREIAAAGDPAYVLGGASAYALTVRTNAEELRAELALRGIDLRGGPKRFSVSLPPGATTRAILAAAAAARAAVIELVPLL